MPSYALYSDKVRTVVVGRIWFWLLFTVLYFLKHLVKFIERILWNDSVIRQSVRGAGFFGSRCIFISTQQKMKSIIIRWRCRKSTWSRCHTHKELTDCHQTVHVWVWLGVNNFVWTTDRSTCGPWSVSRYGITPRIRLLLHTYNFVVYREPHLTGPFECAVYARKRPIGQAPLYRRGAIWDARVALSREYQSVYCWSS